MPCRHPKTAYYRWPHRLGLLFTERCTECGANVRASGASGAGWAPMAVARRHAPYGDIEALPLDPWHPDAGGRGLKAGPWWFQHDWGSE